MSRKLNCIMLIDDNPDDNFFHERVIKKADAANTVIKQTSGSSAIEYLTSKSDHPDHHPDLIFLDINMPGMNGWEFLDEYKKLRIEFRVKAIVVMLTTSKNPDDREKALALNIVSDFESKPLTADMLKRIIKRNFP